MKQTYQRATNLVAVFATIFIFGAIAQASVGGFAGGNIFHYTPAEGDVLVNCPRSGGGGIPGTPTGPSSASFRCYGYVFSPAESAQFVGPVTTADQVELTATHADGTTRTKSSAYDGGTGRSVDTFNLWIETLFQRPLLKVGRNDITWSLFSGGHLVQSGAFIADVVQKPTLSCPLGSTTSWDPDGCSSSTSACTDYFQEYGRDCR